MSATATTFEPVEFWNARYPNEWIRIPTNKKDRAQDKIVKFFAGYFLATEKWQVDAIETHAREAQRANMPNSVQCKKCGWSTKNSDLYEYHLDQHA